MPKGSPRLRDVHCYANAFATASENLKRTKLMDIVKLQLKRDKKDRTFLPETVEYPSKQDEEKRLSKAQDIEDIIRADADIHNQVEQTPESQERLNNTQKTPIVQRLDVGDLGIRDTDQGLLGLLPYYVVEDTLNALKLPKLQINNLRRVIDKIANQLVPTGVELTSIEKLRDKCIAIDQDITIDNDSYVNQDKYYEMKQFTLPAIIQYLQDVLDFVKDGGYLAKDIDDPKSEPPYDLGPDGVNANPSIDGAFLLGPPPQQSLSITNLPKGDLYPQTWDDFRGKDNNLFYQDENRLSGVLPERPFDITPAVLPKIAHMEYLPQPKRATIKIMETPSGPVHMSLPSLLDTSIPSSQNLEKPLLSSKLSSKLPSILDMSFPSLLSTRSSYPQDEELNDNDEENYDDNDNDDKSIQIPNDEEKSLKTKKEKLDDDINFLKKNIQRTKSEIRDLVDEHKITNRDTHSSKFYGQTKDIHKKRKLLKEYDNDLHLTLMKKLSGHGIGCGKGRGLTVSKTGKFGRLKIDMDHLPRLHLIAKDGKEVVAEGGIHHHLYELLTKRYDNRKKYSPESIEQFKRLAKLAQIPMEHMGKYDKKGKILRGESLGEGIKSKLVLYNGPEDLLKLYDRLIGSWEAGSRSQELKQELTEVLDKLVQSNIISDTTYQNVVHTLIE